MTKRFWSVAAFSLAALLASTLALALPTVQQVEAQVAQGHYAQAETMMGEVVAAKPGSARAHYVYAEILAHNELLAKAAEQARLARTLDPSLAFAGTPEKFRSFERALQRAQSPPVRSPAATTENPIERIVPAPVQRAEPRATPAPASAGIPSWLWGVGLAVVAVMLWRGLSRRTAGAAAGPGAVGPAAAGMGSPYGTSPYGPGGAMNGGMQPGAVAPASRGGGLLGAGLAGAGGFAAGMALDHLLNPRHDGAGGNGGTDRLAGLGPDGGRLGDAGNDLPDRNIDFGTGGDDWGGDAGGSVDVGGGGDGGGGWDS